MRSAVRAALAALIVIPLAASGAYAAWSRSPYNSGVQVMPGFNLNTSRQALPDGTGGTFILMLDVRSGATDLYMQRITSQGAVAPGWPAGGVPVCTAANSQDAQFMLHGTSMISDGAGGVYVAFADQRVGPPQIDIYAQRITGAGAIAPGWPANGLAVSTRSNIESLPQICSDGAGGAFLAWDLLYAPGDVDIYGARVTPAGTVAWSQSLYSPTQVQKEVRIASDNAGGFFIAFIDSLPSSPGEQQIRAGRYSSGGVSLFNVLACAANWEQHDMEMIADGIGGIYLAWTDYRTGSRDDIYAHHLDANCQPTQGWLVDGNPVCTAPGSRTRPEMIRDNVNGVLIAWDEYPPPSSSSDIYMQRLTLSGSVAVNWPINGLSVCSANNFQNLPLMVPDGTGGAILTWFDERGSATFNQEDAYAQRIMGNGVRGPGWPVDGVPVHIAPYISSPYAIAPDTLGGAISVFGEASTPNTTITRAQRIDRFGALGNAEPDISAVTDVPNDQGGRVQIRWDASYLDNAPDFGVTEYWIWRNTTLSAAQQAVANGAQWLQDLDVAETGPVTIGDAVRGLASGAGAKTTVRPVVAPGQLFHQTVVAGVQVAWEFIGSVPASARPDYSYAAATLVDDTPSSHPYTRFLVQARRGGAGQAYWDSAPDSAISVDNVAPAAPDPFNGTYASGTSNLSWEANEEPDVAKYRLHRGLGAGFVPSPANLIAETTQLTWTDNAGGPFHYKLAAVDQHGNVGAYAFTAPAGTVDAPPAVLPTELALAPISPNPARAGVSFRFDLPGEGAVQLTLHDALGRRVRTIASGVRAAGKYQESWDGRDESGNRAAAGIYLVTLEAGGRTLHRRFAFMK